MAGSLIKVDEFTVSSAVASVIIGGGTNGSSGLNASIDSTYDVYMFKVTNMTISADTTMKMRLTYSGGTPDTTANYDRATKQLRADTTFGNVFGANANYFSLGSISTSALQESFQSIFYLFNFNNAGYSFVTVEDVTRNTSGALRGQQGGFVVTQTRANDGVQILTNNANNIETGKFSLYGLKK